MVIIFTNNLKVLFNFVTITTIIKKKKKKRKRSMEARSKQSLKDRRVRDSAVISNQIY